MRKIPIPKFIAEMTADLEALQMTRDEFFRSLLRFDRDCMTPLVHEAGHAIAAWALGFPILELNVREFNSDGEGGYQKFLSYAFDAEEILSRPVETQTDMAIVTLSGIAAQARAFPKRFSDPANAEAWEGDLERVGDYIRCLQEPDDDFGDVFLPLYGTAKEIVDKEWDRLEMLVIGAMQYGPVLSGRQVVELIEGAVPRRKRRPFKRPVADRCKMIYSQAAGDSA
jgi:hypothetical protein